LLSTMQYMVTPLYVHLKLKPLPLVMYKTLFCARQTSVYYETPEQQRVFDRIFLKKNFYKGASLIENPLLYQII